VKRIGGIWERVTSFENLLAAYRQARKGKRGRPDVAAFGLALETELLRLQAELITERYRPGGYRQFTVYERKPRRIAAAPFRDRVVHHAVMNLIEPPIDRRFIFHSYACRLGKGAHRAVRCYQRWARRYPYVLKLDIAAYFPSIDRQRLAGKLRHFIKDAPVLRLLDRIIATGPAPKAPPPRFAGDDLLTPLEHPTAIPIGNLTSQFFANLYLDAFDHWMQERTDARAYLRYVDDMVVLGDDKAKLGTLREAVRARLADERLCLHPRKAEIYRTRDGLDLLGYRVFPDFVRLRDENGHRFARRLRGLAGAYARYRIDWEQVGPSVQSWIGHAKQADTAGLRRELLKAAVFRRDRLDPPADVAGGGRRSSVLAQR
jgi:hypothetical protein